MTGVARELVSSTSTEPYSALVDERVLERDVSFELDSINDL